jgi:hypothetical protein
VSTPADSSAARWLSTAATRWRISAPGRWLARSLAGVTAMWSEAADARPLAICRIILFWHAASAFNADAYARYMLVAELAWQPHSYFIFLSPPSQQTARLLCTVYAGACLMATGGVLYRFAAPVAAILGLYLAGMLQNFGKALHTYHLFSVALVILALSRASDAWSIDDLVRRIVLLAKGRKPESRPPSVEYRWPILFVGSSILVMYGAAGLSKLYISGFAWALSDSFRQTLLESQFDGNVPNRVGVWLADYPILCRAMALGALLIEATAWLGLINRYLYWVWALFVMLLQFGIWFLMGVVFGQLPTMFLFFVPWNFLMARIDAVLSRLRPLLARRA